MRNRKAALDNVCRNYSATNINPGEAGETS